MKGGIYPGPDGRLIHGDGSEIGSPPSTRIPSGARMEIYEQRDLLKSFANSVITQANGDLTDKAFRPYVKALAINTLASL